MRCFLRDGAGGLGEHDHALGSRGDVDDGERGEDERDGDEPSFQRRWMEAGARDQIAARQNIDPEYIDLQAFLDFVIGPVFFIDVFSHTQTRTGTNRG